MTTPAILAIDEGTTGTRAALVGPDGAVSGQSYRRLTVRSPRAGVVEQDAEEILARTLDVIADAVGSAGRRRVVAVALANQRGTAVLWDTGTGRALTPAVVWQDTRYAEELARLAPEWDADLWKATGRPVGVRSFYLWAARAIREIPAVGECHRAGRLAFGTIDSWLLFHSPPNGPGWPRRPTRPRWAPTGSPSTATTPNGSTGSGSRRRCCRG